MTQDLQGFEVNIWRLPEVCAEPAPIQEGQIKEGAKVLSFDLLVYCSLVYFAV
jgi:hypothetical protein